MSIRFLLTSLVFLAACNNKAEDTGPAGPPDADGDGFNAQEDCDDADANVYPGAADGWYDGIDSDCGGEDDYDADSDGVRSSDYGGADCNDADATISPALTETWYDGVDTDCKGDDDFDADVDGVRAADYGGTDCDDLDGTVYPGAPDAWYDGVDSNCDGASDYDADGDGQDSDAYSGTDCDDNSAATYLGATEIWYDGVDEDCDGADDYDADGDSYASNDYTGTDCDDTDPDAHPGASEQIDGHDTDCDGTADDFNVEETYGGTFIMGTEEDGWFGWAVAAGDLDGDGLDDLAMTQLYDMGTSAVGDGMVHIMLGSDIGTSPTTVASANYSLLTTATSGTADTLAMFPDLDSDGGAELLIGAPSADEAGAFAMAPPENIGEVYLFTSAELGTVTRLNQAARTFTGVTSDGGFGTAAGAIGDLDGDGTQDLLITAPDANSQAMIFLGATIATVGSWAANDSDASFGGTDSFGAAIAPAGDLDGDGYDDFFVGAPDSHDGAGAVYALLGATTITSGPVGDVSWATIIGDNAGDAAGSALATDDLDADGQLDLVVGAPMQDTQAGRVHYLDGASLAAGEAHLADYATVTYTGTTPFGDAGTSLALGDVDGDGGADLFVGGPGDSDGGGDAGAAWLVTTSATGARALADADVSFVGGSEDDFVGFAIATGDINGDGLDDVIMGVPGEDSLVDEGAVYIGFSGF